MSFPVTPSSPVVELPDSLESASFFVAEPFPIFEMHDFLEPAFYDALVKDVLNRNEFDRVFKRKGNKRKFSLGGHNIDELDDSPLKSLVSFCLSDDLFAWFVKTHLPYYDSESEPIYVLDKSLTDVAALKADAERSGRRKSFYNLELHYSAIPQGGFIPPHTDAPGKRMSLVLYLPEESLPPDMQHNLGTVFYGPRPGTGVWERFSSGLLNEKQSARFLEQHEVAHVSLFEPNKCIGFIKSDRSWHAVAPNAFDYDRWAIVINILEI